MKYKVRFYSSYINHFIQPDSIIPDYTNPQSWSWNRYSYVGNNPIMRNDPTGHKWDDCSNVKGGYKCKIHMKHAGPAIEEGNRRAEEKRRGAETAAGNSGGLTIGTAGSITLSDVSGSIILPPTVFGVTTSGDNWWSNSENIDNGVTTLSNNFLDTIKNTAQNVLAYQYTPIASAAVGVLSGTVTKLSLPFIETPLGLGVFLGAVVVNRIAGGVSLASTFYQYHNNLYGTNFTDVVVSGGTYFVGWLNPLWEQDSSIVSLLYSGYRLKYESPIQIPPPDSWGN